MSCTSNFHFIKADKRLGVFSSLPTLHIVIVSILHDQTCPGQTGHTFAYKNLPYMATLLSNLSDQRKLVTGNISKASCHLRRKLKIFFHMIRINLSHKQSIIRSIMTLCSFNSKYQFKYRLVRTPVSEYMDRKHMWVHALDGCFAISKFCMFLFCRLL